MKIAPSPAFYLACMPVFGFMVVSYSTSAQALVQQHAPREMTGRMMSLYTLGSMGTTPLGGLIVGFVSDVFHEVTDASTLATAEAVLQPGGGTTAKEQFDRQLLAALINFANGDPDFDELIDTDGNGIGDTPFLQVIANVEAVRLNPASTNAQIIAAKDLLERINLEQA